MTEKTWYFMIQNGWCGGFYVKIPPKQTHRPHLPVHIRVTWLRGRWGNVVTALFRGYKGVYRVLPDGVERVTHDYQHLGTEGSLGFNVPPWVEKNRGKVVTKWEDRPRYGRVQR